MAGRRPLSANRKLPKLMACMTKTSLEHLQTKILFSLDVLDAKGIRRKKLPLHECLIQELIESGFNESSDYLRDLIYDNIQLLNEDEIGIVVDLRKRGDYLENIVACLQRAEKEREKDNTKQECLELLAVARDYAEKGKGVLWLAEKFFLAAIAVSSQYLIDGGRQKGCCKYYYAKFLLDKFPGADTEEPFNILTEVRDNSIGKPWLLLEPNEIGKNPSETLFAAAALQLLRILLAQARSVRKEDVGKSERLSRLAERRAIDSGDTTKTAEAIIEIGIAQLMMNNLQNAKKTFERAFKIYTECESIDGICESKMHLAAVMQKMGEHEFAAKLLTEMGTIAMQNGLRRQLGRALHLLGELHLRRERPELGTQHLSEALGCFTGFDFEKTTQVISPEAIEDDEEGFGLIYKSREEVYQEEAEQSRLMMGISAGQELMASYFNLVRTAHTCSVAQIKVIEWKLSKSAWWVNTKNHETILCLCKVHNRSPLDVLRIKMEMRQAATMSEGYMSLGKTNTEADITRLRSSRMQNLT